MIINLNLGERSYDIVIERGVLKKAKELLNLERKVLVVTDSGVPKEYAEGIAAQCKVGFIVTLAQGEESKNLENFKKLLHEMLQNDFTRTDCVAAVGGGVVGDLAGFAAASYMRGIDFYNLPTTVLSQIDSSIGGKVAVDFEGVKNVIGAFYQPQKVLIDPDVLKTLAPRQFSNGLAEAIKMSLTSDKELFELFETKDIASNIEEIIVRSLNIKKQVVETDEREKGLRKILNFGHTLGHGIETGAEEAGLFHGECVALGMLPMCEKATRARLVKVLKKANLPTTVKINPEKVFAAARHDKKFSGRNVTIVKVKEPGSFVLEKIPEEKLLDLIKEIGVEA